ncbi:hypothetical protein DEO72_LG10g2660 [Vigna unguiculata]|uniref:Uncharacterized protein n=1 Tax=Vigna unguiculata TaxID=3917 RepID=A0A4D6NHL5_VIGUN|nr:hypothetical protein DEO72_LG10g2660 [Vigna unguiculata]
MESATIGGLGKKICFALVAFPYGSVNMALDGRSGGGEANRGGRYWSMVVLARFWSSQSRAWKRKRRGEKGDPSSGDDEAFDYKHLWSSGRSANEEEVHVMPDCVQL